VSVSVHVICVFYVCVFVCTICLHWGYLLLHLGVHSLCMACSIAWLTHSLHVCACACACACACVCFSLTSNLESTRQSLIQLRDEHSGCADTIERWRSEVDVQIRKNKKVTDEVISSASAYTHTYTHKPLQCVVVLACFYAGSRELFMYPPPTPSVYVVGCINAIVFFCSLYAYVCAWCSHWSCPFGFMLSAYAFLCLYTSAE